MRIRTGRWLLFVSFALALLFAWGVAVGPCRALAASATTEADAAIKRGVELRRRGDDLQALEQFQRAYALQGSARALAQIGFAEQALGRWREAEEHIGQALADTDDGWIHRNRATIEQSRAVVAGHLGSLEVLGGPEGAKLLIDGFVAGRLPLARPVRVAAGRVWVEVHADGYREMSRPVTITAGELSRETIALQKIEVPPVATRDLMTPAPSPAARAAVALGPPLPAIDAPLRPPEDPGGGWQRSAAWIAGGAAVLFASGVVVALIMRGRYAGQVSAAVGAGRCDQNGDLFSGSGSRDCASAATKRDEAESLAVVSGGLAGASALASTIFFALGGRF